MQHHMLLDDLTFKLFIQMLAYELREPQIPRGLSN
jgi:hypothetical protein